VGGGKKAQQNKGKQMRMASHDSRGTIWGTNGKKEGVFSIWLGGEGVQISLRWGEKKAKNEK